MSICFTKMGKSFFKNIVIRNISANISIMDNINFSDSFSDKQELNNIEIII